MKEPGKKIVFDGTLMRKMQEKEKEDSEKIRKVVLLHFYIQSKAVKFEPLEISVIDLVKSISTN